MPVGDLSIQGARLGINLPLTNLAQAYIQSEYKLKDVLFPPAEVGTYGGQVLQFGDSVYDDVDDARADDTPYPEVQWAYEGKPFKLNTRGISWRLGDKRRVEMENLRINWGQIARDELMNKVALRHEIEAVLIATNPANYLSSNRIALSVGSRLSDGANPLRLIRTAKTAIANQIGVEGNVVVIGREVFDELCVLYSNSFVGGGGVVRADLTEQQLATVFGVRRVVVCDALVRRGGVLQKVFGKHIVVAYTNPAALNADRLPYRPTGTINPMAISYGYTYVFRNNPLMYNPYYDNERHATVYQLDYDRSIVKTGVDQNGQFTAGYLIMDAVA